MHACLYVPACLHACTSGTIAAVPNIVAGPYNCLNFAQIVWHRIYACSLKGTGQQAAHPMMQGQVKVSDVSAVAASGREVQAWVVLCRQHLVRGGLLICSVHAVRHMLGSSGGVDRAPLQLMGLEECAAMLGLLGGTQELLLTQHTLVHPLPGVLVLAKGSLEVAGRAGDGAGWVLGAQAQGRGQSCAGPGAMPVPSTAGRP